MKVTNKKIASLWQSINSLVPEDTTTKFVIWQSRFIDILKPEIERLQKHLTLSEEFLMIQEEQQKEVNELNIELSKIEDEKERKIFLSEKQSYLNEKYKSLNDENDRLNKEVFEDDNEIELNLPEIKESDLPSKWKNGNGLKDLIEFIK